MEERRMRDRRSGSERRISLLDKRHNENLRILRVKIIMSTKQVYVGEFQTHEVNERLSDVIDNEKSFITLTDARIDDSPEVIPCIVLNKYLIVSAEEVSSRKALGLEKDKAAA